MTAVEQLNKVRELAERRARYQEKADTYLQDMKIARENMVYWLEMVQICNNEMREIAQRREP